MERGDFFVELNDILKEEKDEEDDDDDDHGD